MIINLRGTSGSGKSTLARGLMALMPDVRPVLSVRNRDTGYVGTLPSGQRLAVVGSYATPCGGCDTIKTQGEIGCRVLDFAAHYDHVVFEGLLVSQIFSRWAAFAAEASRLLALKGSGGYAWVELDTPLDVCIARVKARRAAAGNTKPYDPDNSLTPKWHSCQRNFVKAEEAGLHPIKFDHTATAGDLLKVLGISTIGN